MASRGKGAAQKPGRRKAARRFGYVKWIVIAGVLGAVVYGISQMPDYPYTDRHLGMVDFSALTRTEKNAALTEANRARCSCTCNMTLAQCVAIDTTCPVRQNNVERIRRMVDDVRAARPTS